MFVDPPPIHLYRDSVDFRKSINGLSLIVEQELELLSCEPRLFLFCNRGRDKVKILYWDTTGYALWYKRLEKQVFKWPRKIEAQTLVLSSEQLDWLLTGFDVIGHKPCKLTQIF